MAERIPKTSKELQNAIYDDFKRKVPPTKEYRSRGDITPPPYFLTWPDIVPVRLVVAAGTGRGEEAGGVAARRL
jgi:hypothetical protein